MDRACSHLSKTPIQFLLTTTTSRESDVGVLLPWYCCWGGGGISVVVVGGGGVLCFIVLGWVLCGIINDGGEYDTTINLPGGIIVIRTSYPQSITLTSSQSPPQSTT
jgi:hypothetical protein